MVAAEYIGMDALGNILTQLPTTHNRYVCFTRTHKCILDDIYATVRNQPVKIRSANTTIRLFRVNYAHGSGNTTSVVDDRHELIVALYDAWKAKHKKSKMPQNPYKCRRFCDWVFDTTEIQQSDYVAILCNQPELVTCG